MKENIFEKIGRFANRPYERGELRIEDPAEEIDQDQDDEAEKQQPDFVSEWIHESI